MEFHRFTCIGPRPVLPPWMSRESQRMRSPGWASTSTWKNSKFNNALLLYCGLSLDQHLPAKSSFSFHRIPIGLQRFSNFVVKQVLHFCEILSQPTLKSRYGKTASLKMLILIITCFPKVSPQLQWNVFLGPGKNLQLQSGEDAFSLKVNFRFNFKFNFNRWGCFFL